MIESIENIWNKQEIRVLVIFSLSIQILLRGLAGRRKHVFLFRCAQKTSITWKGPLALMFHWFLWFVYLMADYVATVALAYLYQSKINKATSQSKNRHLLMFWAPFFLLHLGGQDTITALSVEDNELWSRHLLTLLAHVVLAIYNYFSSNLKIGALWPPAALMFAIAIFKYCERICSLYRASMFILRSSMITKPDPGPNYAKFMQEYTSSKASGVGAEIKVEVEQHKGYWESQQTNASAQRQPPKYKEVVCKAYEFFPTFKRLFVDLILSYKNREDSQKYFEGLEAGPAYKLIEIELSWMYDILHSKDSVIYAFKHYGWISRGFTLITIIAALILFARSDHTGYERFDTILTYVLLGGAIGLEIIALYSIVRSFWTYGAMRESWFFWGLTNFLFSIREKWRPQRKPRWSNKMAQYSLITYSFVDQHCWWKPIMEGIGLKEKWDHYRYTTYVTVNEDLKELVFQELKKKMKNIEDTASYRRFSGHRGQWALQRKGYYQQFGWSVEAEFDESILLWHIATDLLFHDPEKANCTNKERGISQDISNYMLFLLIVQPFMMPAGIGQIRFGDSCAEARIFLQPEGDFDKGDTVRKILEVNTEYDPGLVKGDRSKSVFFNGCRLAHKLKKQFTTMGNGEQNLKQMWALISVVWVEMLCFAASKCSGQFHAKQLSKGGELLTVVWFLMAHFGMGEQYRIEEGHARAKLIVNK